MTSEQVTNLLDAGHMALGYLVAKEGVDSDIVCYLAKALKEAGSESAYVQSIIRRTTSSLAVARSVEKEAK